MTDKLEKGGDLQDLADFARNWFKENDVEMPTKAKDWQACSVIRGEIPPGCTTGSLRRMGISALNFIKMIQGQDITTKHKNDPITKANCSERTGLIWLSYRVVKKHKRVTIECSACHRKEELDYGAIQRMIKANNKLCRYCRDAGGKHKDLEIYSVEGFEVLGIPSAARLTLKCTTCSKEIERGMHHVKHAEYLVCEHCYPQTPMGTLMKTELGTFHSKIEYLVYKKLLEILPVEDIHLQVSYNELFKTGTKHTADFYIPKLDLVLEVTSKTMLKCFGYINVHDWKLSISDKIKFAYSIKQAEDIVQSALNSADRLEQRRCITLLSYLEIRSYSRSSKVVLETSTLPLHTWYLTYLVKSQR